MVIGMPEWQDDVGGFGVDIDVEFGGGRDVAAFEQAAAHQHDFLRRAR